MLSEYRWAWRQVKTLVDEFKTNVSVLATVAVAPLYTEHGSSGALQGRDCQFIASD